MTSWIWCKCGRHVVSQDQFGLTYAEAGTTFQGRVLELGLPHYSSHDGRGNLTARGLVVEPTDIYKPILADDSGLISVVVFDMHSDGPGPISSVGIPAGFSTLVYASPESLYLVDPWCGLSSVAGQRAATLKLDISGAGGEVELVAAGEVAGRPLNSFSIDEHEGNLRIATSEGVGRNMRNYVSVLGQVGNQLQVIGQTENLVAGESIRSVRFMDTTGYVVTFPEPVPQTRLFKDPLFTLDLTDPQHPTALGELEIPGFSTYLHAVGEDHLLGIGRDADPDTGVVRQLQISLFDVSDLARPRLPTDSSFRCPRGHRLKPPRTTTPQPTFPSIKSWPSRSPTTMR